ncbi:hypothetical protein C8J56DRAFT_142217 [Mycena floridula]|nr:hypothetical protein C8J56DRAFT_142217 [Mycena floridula]
MNLYVTGPSFANGDYSDDSGHVIYRVHTPFKVPGMTTSITREIPSGTDARDTSLQVDGESALDAADHRVNELLAGRFAHLAQIDWKVMDHSLSKIRYGGEEFTPRQFFTKGTHSSWGLKDRVFCAPDGQKYRWVLGPHVPSLFRDDGTPIAKYHRPKPTLFGKHKTDKVRLEIFAEGKDMADLIIVTFVCIEKIRRQIRGDSTDPRVHKAQTSSSKTQTSSPEV